MNIDYAVEPNILGLSACQDPEVATALAAKVFAAVPASPVYSDAYFRVHAQDLLRCYLHAAALQHGSVGTVAVWAETLGTDAPLQILTTHYGDDPGRLWPARLREINALDSRHQARIHGEMFGALPYLIDAVAAEPR